MNIDIVNKQVSKKLNISEGRVEKVNHFYWQCVKEHLYNYDARPVNIESVCVLHPTPFAVKRAIKKTITGIRNLKVSKRYVIGSVKHKATLEALKQTLRNYLSVRKANKYTN